MYYLTMTVIRLRKEAMCLEYKNNIPIYLQVISDIKKKMVMGEIDIGEKLPSTRELAIKYQINPNTAARVYNEMEIEKLVFTKRGLGTFVTEDEQKVNEVKKIMAEEYVEQFIANMKGIGIDKEQMILYINSFKEK